MSRFCLWFTRSEVVCCLLVVEIDSQKEIVKTLFYNFVSCESIPALKLISKPDSVNKGPNYLKIP